jgi:hypothetical protein
MRVAIEWNATHAMGLGAAALIFALGAFVLAARPRVVVTRAFAIFALFDGLSSALFELRDMSTLGEDKLFFYGSYYYFYIASIAMLLGFGLVFPRPVASPRWRAPVLIGLGVLTLAALVVFALNHGSFWRVGQRDGRVVFVRATGGTFVNMALAATIAFVTLKLTRDFLRGPGEGHRRQAAFVLAGLLVGYGSLLPVIVARDLASGASLFSSADLLTRAMGWSYVLATLAILFAVARIARAPMELRQERRFVLGAAGVVVTLTFLALVAPGALPVLQIIGLAIYPILLGYAILRYSVFDIHAHVRRAVTLSAGAAAAAGAFVLAENVVQGLIEDRLASVVTTRWVAGSLAALAAALAVLPALAIARRFAPRIVPDEPDAKLHTRRLDIYRYSVEGAAADGLLDAGELKVLSRLRESLGIADDEHSAILSEVRSRIAA